ncbi:hypothetical protein [Phyllobacterium sophorae]|uniref:hypothetical protein n=1 Tax=Phyllobacterium sophorae TaxID=1520277 RepID=UPI0011B1DC0A|nr:hypothetical protein [Phyllobacterium sophorae]
MYRSYPGFPVPAPWQIGHENPGFFIAVISFSMGGRQLATSCQDGLEDAAHKSTSQPQSLACEGEAK